MFYTKRLTKKHQLENYSDLYQKSSGLGLPLDYLQEARVYGLFVKGQLFAGYVLNNTKIHSRTTKYFTTESFQFPTEKANTIEICCFWMSRRTPRYKFHSTRLWIDIAIRTSLCHEMHLFYGTNKRSLARIYSIPDVTRILTQQEIGGKTTWTFLTKRSDMLRCVWLIIQDRINPFYNLKPLKLWKSKLLPAMAH